MNPRATAMVSSFPRLAGHVRLRLDKARDSWTIQAPERVFMLDTIAHKVVTRCDGAASVELIVNDLCREYGDAPRDAIENDVLNLIQDFVDKGVMTL